MLASWGVLLAHLAPTPARAELGWAASADVLVEGGTDTNLLLTVSPDTPSGLGRAGGVFVATAPALALELRAAGATFEASYLGSYLRSESAGSLWSHELGLGVTSPAWGPLRLEAGAFLGRFQARAFPSNDVDSLGLLAGLSLELGSRARARVGYVAQFRRFPGITEADVTPDRDLLHAVEAGLLARLAAWCRLGPRGFLAYVAPSAPDAQDGFARWRLGIDAVLGYGRPRVTASAWGGGLTVGSYHERQAGGTLRVAYALFQWLEAVAELDGSTPLSTGARSDYTGVAASVALGGSFGGSPAPAPPSSPAIASLRPLAQAGTVRFRLRAEGARSVAVVGSWNGWSPQPLAPGGASDLWEVALAVTPGEHRYRFVVDGALRRPPDALRYVADGFGGVDGVLEIRARAGSE